MKWVMFFLLFAVIVGTKEFITQEPPARATAAVATPPSPEQIAREARRKAVKRLAGEWIEAPSYEPATLRPGTLVGQFKENEVAYGIFKEGFDIYNTVATTVVVEPIAKSKLDDLCRKQGGDKINMVDYGVVDEKTANALNAGYLNGSLFARVGCGVRATGKFVEGTRLYVLDDENWMTAFDCNRENACRNSGYRLQKLKKQS